MRCWKRQSAWFVLLGVLSAVSACGSPDSDDAVLFETVFGSSPPAGDVADEIEDASDCVGVGEPATETRQDLFEALNTYRNERGLSPLAYSKRLEAAADAHLRDMVARGYFDHITPEGLRPPDRALAAGFCHRYVGENLAAGQPTVARVMTAWDKSPTHQRNLQEPDFNYVGLGRYVDWTGRTYWAQLFAFQYP